MTGQIRKTAARDALKQLQNEGLVFTKKTADKVQAWDLRGACGDMKVSRRAGSEAATR